MAMYRIIYRGGNYEDVSGPAPQISDDAWAVLNLDIVEGGSAYQELLRTLDVDVAD